MRTGSSEKVPYAITLCFFSDERWLTWHVRCLSETIIQAKKRHMHKHEVGGPTNCPEFLWCCLVPHITSCCQQAAPAGEERYSAHLVWMEKGSLEDLLFPSWVPEGHVPVGIQSPNDDSLKTNSPVKAAFKHAAKTAAEYSVICSWMWGNDSPWWKAVVLPKKGKTQRSQQHGKMTQNKPINYFNTSAPMGSLMIRGNVLCCRRDMECMHYILMYHFQQPIFTSSAGEVTFKMQYTA